MAAETLKRRLPLVGGEMDDRERLLASDSLPMSATTHGNLGERATRSAPAPIDDPSSRLQTRRKTMLLALHDVSPMFNDSVERMADHLDQRAGYGRYAMFVVPNFHGGAPLQASPAFCRRLRTWAEAGVEMFVHGFYHRDTVEHGAFQDKLKAKFMTASEGEFLGLPVQVASCRIQEGRRLIEDITGHPVAGFVAPAWLYGPGAHAALAQERFGLVEDHFRVWRADGGGVVARSPVITWATRTVPRRVSSLCWAAVARTVCAQMKVVRIGIHPSDFSSPQVIRSIETTVRVFGSTRVAGRYADLLRS